MALINSSKKVNKYGILTVFVFLFYGETTEIRSYKHILLAVGLTPEVDEKPTQKAVTLARQFGARLTVLCAVVDLSYYNLEHKLSAEINVEKSLRVGRNPGRKGSFLAH